MSRANDFPIAEVSGSQERMGRHLGHAYCALAKEMMKDAKAGLARRKVSWDHAVSGAEGFLVYAEDHDPDYIDFIKGYSKGSGIPFDELFTLLCMGEKGRCTDILVNDDATSNGSVLSAHTEDWYSADEKRVVLVKGEPKEGPSFVVATLAGLELVSGLNSAGISFSGNSLEQNDRRVGVPQLYFARKILAARTIGEAISAAAPPNRASSFNNNLCHSSGEIYCVEGSATDVALLYPDDGHLVHTNHYLSPKMLKYEAGFSSPSGTAFHKGSGTIVRYNRAERLIRKHLGSVTVEVLSEILSDHVNSPHSICSHEDSKDPPYERGKTIYAVISDVTRLEMHICKGNACTRRWRTHRVP